MQDGPDISLWFVLYLFDKGTMHFNCQVLVNALDPDQYFLAVTFGNQFSFKPFQAAGSNHNLISFPPGFPGGFYLFVAVDNDFQEGKLTASKIGRIVTGNKYEVVWNSERKNLFDFSVDNITGIRP